MKSAPAWCPGGRVRQNTPRAPCDNSAAALAAVAAEAGDEGENVQLTSSQGRS